MKNVFFIFFAFCFNVSNGQNFKAYITKADSIYQAKSYVKSGELYVEALKLIDEKYVEPVELFNTAKSFAQQKDALKACFYLQKVITRGGVTATRIQTEADFKPIQSSKEWTKVIKRAKEMDEGIDSTLINILQVMGTDDQLYRKKIDSLYLNNVKNNELKSGYFKQQSLLDSLNLIKAKEILDSRGFPSRRLVGRHNAVLFYIIQHADLNYQESYYNAFEAAANRSDLSWRTLCLMTDRIRMRKGLKQLYGTQISTKDGVSVLYEVEDYDHLDERRLKIGLEPIKQYASFFGVRL